MACHGPAGRGNPGPVLPVARRPARRLHRGAPEYFRDRRRTGPRQPSQRVMADIAKHLSDEEIQGLATYIEGLHPRARRPPGRVRKLPRDPWSNGGDSASRRHGVFGSSVADTQEILHVSPPAGSALLARFPDRLQQDAPAPAADTPAAAAAPTAPAAAPATAEPAAPTARRAGRTPAPRPPTRSRRRLTRTRPSRAWAPTTKCSSCRSRPGAHGQDRSRRSVQLPLHPLRRVPAQGQRLEEGDAGRRALGVRARACSAAPGTTSPAPTSPPRCWACSQATHDAVFKGVFVEQDDQGRHAGGDRRRCTRSWGVDKAKFLAAMQSFGVTAKLNRAKQFAMRTGVNATPTIIVNGKYRVERDPGPRFRGHAGDGRTG